METTEEISIAQIVKSKAGRDIGRLFLVIEKIDDKYVLVVDGDLRRLDKPKKKKIRHLVVYNIVLENLKEKIYNNEKFNNAFIRKLLAPFKKEI